MAREVHEFTVTVAPGAGSASSPVSTALAIPAGRVVTEVQLYIPPGPRGTVGLALAYGDQAIVPWESGQYVVSDDEVITWPLTDFPTGGDWRLLAYSTGTYAHTIRVVLLATLVGQAPAPTAAVATVLAIAEPQTVGTVPATVPAVATVPTTAPVTVAPPPTVVPPTAPAGVSTPPPSFTPPPVVLPPTSGGSPSKPSTPVPFAPPPLPALPPPLPAVTIPAVAVLAGQPWYVLGGATPRGTYYGHTVHGGWPVAFTWVGQGTPEIGALPPAGAVGVMAYTPTTTPLTTITPAATVGTPPWFRGYTGTA